jgi:aminoglycoside 3-N-acetyltransferase
LKKLIKMKKVLDEEKVVKKTESPNTIETLKEDLLALGINEGSILIMHSAMSKLGWIVGGPITVIKALLEILTPEGTLVMPAFSSDNTEPSDWQNPPVPEEWWPFIRKNMPPFDPQITPTRNIGIIPEVYRNFPGVIRSSHPALSFTAWGKYREKIINDHKLTSSFGEDSPLARIYDLNGKVLLLGVTHSNNTSLHLAEYRTKSHFEMKNDGSAMYVDGQREWVEWRDIDHNSDDFEKIGLSCETEISYSYGKVGLAQARLFSQRDLVDYAVNWMDKNR